MCSSSQAWEWGVSICLRLSGKEVVSVYFKNGMFYWKRAKGRTGDSSEIANTWGSQWAMILHAMSARNGFHAETPPWASSRAVVHSRVMEVVGRPG